MSVKIKTNFNAKKIEQSIKKQARASLQKESYEIKCPHCQKTVMAYSGHNVCPHCQSGIDLNLNINF